MWRRIHVIEFPRKFSESEMDVELTSKLMDELSGIFNWALEGYRRLRDQGFIFSESPSMLKSKKRYKQKNSSAIDYAESILATSFRAGRAGVAQVYKGKFGYLEIRISVKSGCSDIYRIHKDISNFSRLTIFSIYLNFSIQETDHNM